LHSKIQLSKKLERQQLRLRQLLLQAELVESLKHLEMQLEMLLQRKQLHLP